MNIELVEIEGLGNGQYVFRVGGTTLVRVHVTDFTMTQPMVERSANNYYKIQAWGCDAAGLPAVPSPENPGHYVHGLTVGKDKIGEFGADYLVNQIDTQVTEAAQRTANILAATVRTRLFLATEESPTEAGPTGQ